MTSNVMLNDLAIIIRSYLEGHKNRSLKGLSMRTGVAYATLRRIYQQDATPTMENILPIIQFVCSREEGIQFLKKHFSNFGSWLEDYFNEDQEFIAHDLNRLIQDKENFIIISLAATERGTTRETIRELLGSFGEKKVHNLIDHGVLSEVKGVIKTIQSEFGSVDPDSVLAQIRNATEIFNKQRLGTSTAMAGMQTEGVSEEGLKKIFKVMVSAEMEISKIRKENIGEHTMFAGFILNVIEG
ncbi:hypothetical protein [Pseudobacteriovorax antillogorgiicola]|uniref:Uncharacterized protein n=1 Tax=Pseudobacteriovorax antillogorgiicola TaxID=1513793 RepID=A0A1Y6CH53_9BACT|nr:hypothetical protein [Pseudobacteriovorax antillogorgiicola]TCS47288.1 hypothetical protein EDD56_12163 [Pseudobacteriovorax antillogorgiicola]SMF62360.1 hypothetical protein SAMN06296036_12163 [Pseudobacteriovorax antillogorgiicola]